LIPLSAGLGNVGFEVIMLIRLSCVFRASPRR
jgi:hypothetical protein